MKTQLDEAASGKRTLVALGESREGMLCMLRRELHTPCPHALPHLCSRAHLAHACSFTTHMLLHPTLAPVHLLLLGLPPADCGAGVGRVSKELLLHVFQEVDLLEPSKHLLEAAGGRVALGGVGGVLPG